MSAEFTVKMRGAAVVAALLIVAPMAECRGAEHDSASSATVSNEIPSSFELKEGPTTADETTSHAVEAILRRTAEAYGSARHFHARGRYIQAYKSKRLGENLNDAQLEIFYRRPDHLKIQFTGKGMEVCFAADGTTVTQLNGEKREYIQMPQPDSLAAFSEEERAGEIADDETNSIPNSIAAPLLITPNPLAWLHSNVQQYVYEGVEDVKTVDPVTSETRRVQCWRIKFVQDNPKLVVENWIDRDTYFFRKLSVIQAVDEQGDFVESYASASRARMRVAIYDQISTSPDESPLSSIRLEIPRGYKYRKFTPEPADSDTAHESVWSKLVRAAVAEKGEKTTSVSLQHERGADMLRMSVVADVESRITVLQAAGDALGSPAVLVGASNKQLSIFTPGTSEPKRVSLPHEFDQLALLKRDGGAPLIVSANSGSDSVYGYDMQGVEQWNYTKDGTLESIATCPNDANSLVYVGYKDGRGVRALDRDGKVKFATRRISMVSGLTVAQHDQSAVPLLVRSSSDIGCFSKDLKVISRFSSESLAGPCEIDWTDNAYPIVGIGFTSADDVLLQRVAIDGTTSWTMNLAPESSDIKGAAVDFARLRLAETSGTQTEDADTTRAETNASTKVQRCIVALLSDGRLSIVTPEGELVYRGRLNSVGTMANRKDSWQAFGLAIADMDGDGEDEIYTASDSQVLRITTSAKQ